MHYFLRQNLIEAQKSARIIGHSPVPAELNWVSGQAFKGPPPPIELTLDYQLGYNFPDIFDAPLPLLSVRLLKSLRSIGASNIDSYPVILNNGRSKYQGFYAINVIGCVNTIEEAAAQSLKVFRWREKPELIAVDQEIANHLEKFNWSVLSLQGNGECDASAMPQTTRAYRNGSKRSR